MIKNYKILMDCLELLNTNRPLTQGDIGYLFDSISLLNVRLDNQTIKEMYINPVILAIQVLKEANTTILPANIKYSIQQSLSEGKTEMAREIFSYYSTRELPQITEPLKVALDDIVGYVTE